MGKNYTNVSGWTLDPFFPPYTRILPVLKLLSIYKSAMSFSSVCRIDSLRVLQKFAKTEENEDGRQNCRSTRGTIDLRFGNLVLELFFNFLRYESSLLRPDRRRSCLLSNFLREHSPGFCPVLPSSDVQLGQSC